MIQTSDIKKCTKCSNLMTDCTICSGPSTCT